MRLDAAVERLLAPAGAFKAVLPAPLAALPAPHSPEALEAFGAACRAVDRAGFLDDAERATMIIVPGGIRLWTSDAVQAAQAGNFSCFTSEEAAAARVTPKVRLDDLLVLTLRRELRMAEAVQASRMRELFALAYPDDQEEVADDTPDSADPVGFAIEAHRSARAALTAACNPADEVFVAQAGGDTSDEAMAPARAIHEVASDAETDAWDALLETRPTDPDGLLRMLRYIAGAGPMEVLGDAREFGRNIAEAAEAALSQPAPADASLIALGQRFDTLHVLWREAEEANREPSARRAAAIKSARGLPSHEFYEAERAAWKLPGVSEAHDRADAAFEALEPVCTAIFGTPAEGVAGLAVKARATISAIWGNCRYEADASQGDDENWDRRAVRQLIESCCAAAGVDWRGQPQGTVPTFVGYSDAPGIEPEAGLPAVDPDPILAGIAETRAALDQALALEAASTGNLPAAWGEARDRAVKVLREQVLLLSPTTLDGCRAAAQLMLDLRPGLGLELEDEVTLLLKRIAGEPAAAAEAPAATPEPSLLDQILDGWRAWGARPDLDESEAGQATFDRLSERRNALIDAAERLPATPENVLPKALAFAWLEYISLWRHGDTRQDYGTDGRLALDIDTAICGRLKTRHAGVAA